MACGTDEYTITYDEHAVKFDTIYCTMEFTILVNAVEYAIILDTDKLSLTYGKDERAVKGNSSNYN